MAEENKYYRHFYTSTPQTSTKVLTRGEMGFFDVGAGYWPAFKIGDGTSEFKDLPIAGNLNISVFETEAGASRQLALSDLGVCFKMTNSSGGQILLPANVTVDLPVGFMCEVFWWAGATAHTVKGAPGVSVETISEGTFTLTKQYSRAIIEKVDTDLWIVKGEGTLA